MTRHKFLWGLGIMAVMIMTMAAWPAGGAGGSEIITEEMAKKIDAIVMREIDKGNFPGAVVSIGRKNGALFTKAYGNRIIKPEKAVMQADTIFDIASLSKAVATAPSVLLLVESGKIRLDDPVVKFLPEFGAEGKEGVLIRHLLAHVSGLPAYLAADALRKEHGEVCPEAVIEAICKLKPQGRPGEKLCYSCLGYITLGKIVEKVAGQGLDEFAREYLFKPMGMKDTGYKPATAREPRLAGTAWRGEQAMTGKVHDPLAGLMGGVSGNAGVFATAEDLGVMCRMILNGGKWGEKQILPAESVALLTQEQDHGRAYGYDVSSDFAWIKGDKLSAAAFCHSGYTGTSLVCDPQKDWYIVILTNRVHPEDKGSVMAVRKEIANLAGGW